MKVFSSPILYSRYQRQQSLDFLPVAGRVGGDAATESVDGRSEVVQLGVVDEEEAVVEVIGVRGLRRFECSNCPIGASGEA